MLSVKTFKSHLINPQKIDIKIRENKRTNLLRMPAAYFKLPAKKRIPPL